MPARTVKKAKGPQFSFLNGSSERSELETCLPPRRIHSSKYHRPLLLNDNTTNKKLLNWFDGSSENRQMPWRKPWLSPTDFQGTEKEFRKAQAKRAYEVWVSEIMLQQTRVSVVIPYFNKWIAKWPTVQDLAAADQEEVLAAWKGLGYYSRATRLHEAAQQIVADMEGLLPADATGLLSIKGIGKYTAGAVSSIAFGRAEPLLDGNVARVLCRQLGLYARVKEKKIDDVLWEVADMLVKDVADYDGETDGSDVPGRWNQALMELGSTICTPKPKCAVCPIQATCRAHAEGQLLDRRPTSERLTNVVGDIEDACTLCEPLELEEVEEAAQTVLDEQSPQATTDSKGRKRAGTTSVLTTRPAKTTKSGEGKQRSLKDFASFATMQASKSQAAASTDETKQSAEVLGYCSTFPKRESKKAVPEEECIVCVICWNGAAGQKYLIEQRPAKGLLASLWQFPTYTMPAKVESNVKHRKAKSSAFVKQLLHDATDAELTTSSEKGSIIHVFSHLKLQMHVQPFVLECSERTADMAIRSESTKRLWVDKAGVDSANLGTGMVRCWQQYLNSI